MTNNLQDIYKEYIGGISLTKLSKKYGIDRCVLSKDLKVAGFPIVGRYNQYKDKLSDIILLYKNKISIRSISKQTNIPITQIWRLLKENGIESNKFYEYEKYRKYFLSESFDNIDTPDKAYFLGFLYADGNVHSKLNHVTLKIKHSDIKILNDLKDAFKLSSKIYVYKSKKKNVEDQCALKIINWKIRQNFIKHGVIPRKTWRLKFPFWLDKTLRSHFIRGYFDGDGCISQEVKSKNVTISICGTEQMCKDIQFLLSDQLGIKSSVSPDRKIFRVRIRRYKDIVRFCDWMYNEANLFLQRKLEKFEDIRRNK